MESIAAGILPPDVSTLAAVGLVALSLFTSALTAAAGIGGGLVLISVMASFLTPVVVIPVHGVVQLGSNAGRGILMRQHIDRGIFWPFALGSILGIALGAKLFVALPTPVLQTILGAFVLACVWLPKLEASKIPYRGFTLVGMVGSFCTMFVGATGPFIASFISPERLQRHAVVATHAACMCVQHSLKVVAFGFLGFAFLPWLPLLAAMIVAGFLGTVIGKRLLDHIPHRIFARAFKIVLTVLAVRLLYSAAFAAWSAASATVFDPPSVEHAQQALPLQLSVSAARPARGVELGCGIDNLVADHDNRFTAGYRGSLNLTGKLQVVHAFERHGNGFTQGQQPMIAQNDAIGARATSSNVFALFQGARSAVLVIADFVEHRQGVLADGQ